MRGIRWLIASVCCAVSVLALTGDAGAIFLDGAHTLSLTGKAQARVSLRLADAEGFTYPPDITVGDMVQQRNLVLLEVDHDLKSLTNDLALLYPLKVLKLRAKYHLVGRFMYEGVYDYGAKEFRDVREQDKEDIDNFKQSNDLWECYLDLSRGPLFLRLGKQNLSWGETDMFRVLDNINPLDNTFGGPFEDLDDRRIPLLMVRGSYNLGNVGPVKSLSLESFWVPGFWDAHVAPWAPKGTPYAAPLAPDLLRFLTFDHPDKKMDSSRWGFRLLGVLGSNLNLSLAHYRTFLDMPALRAVVQGTPVPAWLQPVLSSLAGVEVDSILTSPNDMAFEASYPAVQITGASLNYYEPHTDVIVRGDFGCFWDEPVLIPQSNLRVLYDPVLPLSPEVLALASKIFGVDIQSLGLNGLPVNPRSGDIPKKDILRFALGLDKQFWIRPLNHANTFFVSLQYFGQWIPDYDSRLRQGLEVYPNPVEFVPLNETEHVITAVTNSFYWNGRLTPQIGLAYDVRGTWLVQPQLSLILKSFRFVLQYSMIKGTFTNFGAFRDRDQITFIVNYLLN
jgi:hypothetical protein